jgi:hypothetical protein
MEEWQPVKSSNIHSLYYDYTAMVLKVCFAKKKKAEVDEETIKEPGDVYSYRLVTPEVYDKLIADNSIGSAFHRLIRNDKAIETTKIVPEPGPEQEG